MFEDNDRLIGHRVVMKRLWRIGSVPVAAPIECRHAVALAQRRSNRIQKRTTVHNAAVQEQHRLIVLDPWISMWGARECRHKSFPKPYRSWDRLAQTWGGECSHTPGWGWLLTLVGW